MDMGSNRKITGKKVLWICSVTFFGMVACAPKPEEKVEVIEPRYIDMPIGTVSSVEDSSNIVLFRTYHKLAPEGKSVFITKGLGNIAVLNLTGQSNRFFVAAERASGIVSEGDAVFRRDINPKYKGKIKPEESGISNEIGPQDFTETFPGGAGL